MAPSSFLLESASAGTSPNKKPFSARAWLGSFFFEPREAHASDPSTPQSSGGGYSSEKTIPSATSSVRDPRLLEHGDEHSSVREPLNIVGSYCSLADRYLLFERPELLRGVLPATILSQWGAHLKSPQPVDGAFELSKQVERLDLYVSHSWSASRTLKTLAILHALNMTPALVASSTVAIALFALQLARGTSRDSTVRSSSPSPSPQ